MSLYISLESVIIFPFLINLPSLELLCLCVITDGRMPLFFEDVGLFCLSSITDFPNMPFLVVFQRLFSCMGSGWLRAVTWTARLEGFQRATGHPTETSDFEMGLHLDSFLFFALELIFLNQCTLSFNVVLGLKKNKTLNRNKSSHNFSSSTHNFPSYQHLVLG